jgi:ribosomal protein S18 acetylase RimI-like enzyme
MTDPAVVCEPVVRDHVPGIMRLCEAEGWPSYIEDKGTTWNTLTAPGVITMVALFDGEVVGFAQLQTDRYIQAHLSTIAVSRSHRRLGIGRLLIDTAFQRSGAKRIDLICEGPEAFYESFAHRRFTGFRVYPQYDQSDISVPPR